MKQYFLFLIILLFSFNHSLAQKIDSLHAKRVFLTTYIYKDGLKLSDSKVMKLYKDTWQPNIKYKWSIILKPIGPVVAVGGVGLAAIALKGVDATKVIDGQTINYKIRSLPKLLMGIGLFVGGLSIVESSNELAQHSVNIYNSKLKDSKQNAFKLNIESIKLGITESDALGFSIFLK